MNDSENLKLFHMASGGSAEQYGMQFKKAYEEDKDTAVQILLFTGDRHHGASSSQLLDAGLKQLCLLDPKTAVRIAQIIPEYGTWGDLLVLLHYETTKPEAVHLFIGRINADINLINERRPSSDFSLYMPRGSSSEGKLLADAFELSAEQYDSFMHVLAKKAAHEEIHSDFNDDCVNMNEEQMKKTIRRYERVIELMHSF